MATIKAFIRTKKKDKETFIRFRISDGRNVQLYHVSELKILPSLWDEKREQYKAKCVVRTDERIWLNTAVAERKKLLLTLYDSTPGITSSKLDSLVDECIHPEKHPEKRDDFFSLMELCLQKKKLSKLRAKDFRTLMYILKRYEMFVSAYKGKPFKLSVDEMDVNTLEDIESFFINEHNLYVEYPEIYKEIRASIEPEYHFLNPSHEGIIRYVHCLAGLESFITGVTIRILPLITPLKNTIGTRWKSMEHLSILRWMNAT